MDNKAIADVFEEIGNILDISGANFFRVNAYRKAALTVMNLPQDLRGVVRDDPDSLQKIPGIGKDLQKKIIEMVETGKCEEHQRLKKTIPEGLLEILELRGLGPKKVKKLYMELAIKNLKELKAAAEKGLIRTLDGMGPKSEEDILRALEEHSQFSTKRHLISEAQQEVVKVMDYLRELKDINTMQYAGSLRRRRETIGDLDILVTVKDSKKSHKEIMEYFAAYPEVINVTAQGETKTSVILSSGIQVDLRVVDDESFGAALHYFTGSKDHNVKVRDLAKKKGLKVNEYGVFKGEEKIAGKTEEEIFKAVGLPFIDPELRENRGEFENELPELLELKDIKADLHNHSTYSDGKNSILEMARKFEEMGYKYCAITDHSKAVGVTGGMDSEKIKKQWKEIDEANEKVGIKVLKGCEVDILKDGSLDFEDEILEQLDVVVISAHLHTRLDRDVQTKRLIKAIEHPCSMILGHPTARLLNKRGPMEFDMEKVIKACVENRVALEINSNPLRLDLADKYVRIAKEMGAKFVINTDSHSTDHPHFMEYGIGVARRGWLTAKDVLNAGSFKEFDSYFQKRIIGSNSK